MLITSPCELSNHLLQSSEITTSLLQQSFNAPNASVSYTVLTRTAPTALATSATSDCQHQVNIQHILFSCLLHTETVVMMVPRSRMKPAQPQQPTQQLFRGAQHQVSHQHLLLSHLTTMMMKNSCSVMSKWQITPRLPSMPKRQSIVNISIWQNHAIPPQFLHMSNPVIATLTELAEALSYNGSEISASCRAAMSSSLG